MKLPRKNPSGEGTTGNSGLHYTTTHPKNQATKNKNLHKQRLPHNPKMLSLVTGKV